MTSRAAASRYAKALFEVALKESDPVQVGQDLDAFVALLANHPALERVLTNPAIPAPRKRATVEALVARADRLTPVAGKLLVLLAERDRLTLMRDLVAAYQVRLMDHQQVVAAEVTSAVPLSEEGSAALAKRLADATARRVTLTTRVDPAIIGGVVAKVGSVVFDGSVTRQLARIKEKLVEEA
jgi:F-type H+-transporting ATPase subunit delta